MLPVAARQHHDAVPQHCARRLWTWRAVPDRDLTDRDWNVVPASHAGDPRQGQASVPAVPVDYARRSVSTVWAALGPCGRHRPMLPLTLPPQSL
jgi:hypothetical protein